MPIGEFFMRISLVHKIINDRIDLVDELFEPLMENIKDVASTYKPHCSAEDQLNFCRNFRIRLLFSGVLK